VFGQGKATRGDGPGTLPYLLLPARPVPTCPRAKKLNGQAKAFDLVTPDAGELAFLADETAPHPFYTWGFILHEEHNVAGLIQRAYAGGNAATFLLVKGGVDHVAHQAGVLATVDSPCEEAMAGTGDTLTGMAAALLEAGWETAAQGPGDDA